MKGQIQTQKLYGHNCTSKFSCMMPISYPKIWVPNFVFKTRIPLTLAQNVLGKLRNNFKPNQCTLARDLEQQNPNTGVYEKF